MVHQQACVRGSHLLLRRSARAASLRRMAGSVPAAYTVHLFGRTPELLQAAQEQLQAQSLPLLRNVLAKQQ